LFVYDFIFFYYHNSTHPPAWCCRSTLPQSVEL
jgi:hypothetical protein